jgi:hypothetical protein
MLNRQVALTGNIRDSLHDAWQGGTLRNRANGTRSPHFDASYRGCNGKDQGAHHHCRHHWFSA